MDIFAASPVEGSDRGEMKRRASDNQPVAASFTGGDESDQAPVTIREVGKVAAPLNGPGVAFKPGSRVRIDTVVRTRKIGHAFPGGTIDGFDIWIDFQAKDADGKILAWSGKLEDGTGYVEKGAHFYRAYVIDGDGNRINKRNLWQGRSVLYARAIPPGAADTVHYLVDIPKDAKGPISIEAKLNYRKFSEYYNKFTFSGVAGTGAAGKDFDSRTYTFDNRPVNKIPIVTLATARVAVPVGEPQWSNPMARKQDRERWNDWGIGMLLQGDLKGAEYAFQKVQEAEPGYADGYVNVARALIQEGETEQARPHLEHAISITPNLARAYYFLGLVERAAGEYDKALADLEVVRKQYPRDRFVTNQMGRIMFLQRRYPEAIQVLEQSLSVEPEDLTAHYNLMLCYRGSGQAEKAEREQALFVRFKADESAQALNGQTRLMNPEDNNERQQIHDHTSDPGVLGGRPILSKAPGKPAGN
jgi:tetratricopeptide (TPR) repeat protein